MALNYVQSVFLNEYLSTYNDPNLWKSLEQEARAIGKEFAIRLYTAIAQSSPDPGPIATGWPDPRVNAVRVLNDLQYSGLNALLVPLVTLREGSGPSGLTLAAVAAVLPASGSRTDEPTATLRRELMKGLTHQTVHGPGRNSDTYLDALSTLDGQLWGPVQLYMPQPGGGNQKNLYVRLFDGLVSNDAARFIDLSSPDMADAATVSRSVIKCPARDGMRYAMEGCKGELFLESVTIVDNGRIQCTATVRDTSHTVMQGRNDGRVLYTVEISLVPQGQGSNDWKSVGLKIVNSGSNTEPKDPTRPEELKSSAEPRTAPNAGPPVQPAPAREGGAATDEQLQKLAGRWKLISESNSKVASPKVYIIEVDGAMITMGSPGGRRGIHYIDGRPEVYTDGARISSSTRWNGGVLVIDAKVSNSNGTVVSQFSVDYSVSVDGRTLTRHIQHIGAGGTASESTAVYSRE